MPEIYIDKNINNMTKVLVCGATGFIGRNIAERLSQRTDIELHLTRFKRPEFPVINAIWHQIDLTKFDQTNNLVKGMDVIIQAAAVTSGAKDIINNSCIHVTDNAVMNSFLFRSAHDHKVKHVVFFSCSIIYETSEFPIKEQNFDPGKPLYKSYFGAGHTKLYLEKMCEFFSSIGSCKYTVIRHSNIYGPYDKFDLERSHVFGATITKVMIENERIYIWGSGMEKRDLLNVSDLCNFVEKALIYQDLKFRIYNCGSGVAISVLDLAKKIIKASGKKLLITHDPKGPNINTSLYLDCELAKNELGWVPNISLDDGIINTLHWWKQNIDPNTLKLKLE